MYPAEVKDFLISTNKRDQMPTIVFYLLYFFREGWRGGKF